MDAPKEMPMSGCKVPDRAPDNHDVKNTGGAGLQADTSQRQRYSSGDNEASLPAQSSNKFLAIFDRFSSVVTKKTGSPFAFCLALAMVIIWGVTGPLFGYSETWQLVINTGTTIVTFLMVFVIQQSQNKDCEAVHLKLNELLKAKKNARNEMIDIENLTEEQLQQLSQQFKRNQAQDD